MHTHVRWARLPSSSRYRHMLDRCSPAARCTLLTVCHKQTRWQCGKTTCARRMRRVGGRCAPRQPGWPRLLTARRSCLRWPSQQLVQPPAAPSRQRQQFHAGWEQLGAGRVYTAQVRVVCGQRVRVCGNSAQQRRGQKKRRQWRVGPHCVRVWPRVCVEQSALATTSERPNAGWVPRELLVRLFAAPRLARPDCTLAEHAVVPRPFTR